MAATRREVIRGIGQATIGASLEDPNEDADQGQPQASPQTPPPAGTLFPSVQFPGRDDLAEFRRSIYEKYCSRSAPVTSSCSNRRRPRRGQPITIRHSVAGLRSAPP